jgi:hypothetical protein
VEIKESDFNDALLEMKEDYDFCDDCLNKIHAVYYTGHDPNLGGNIL